MKVSQGQEHGYTPQELLFACQNHVRSGDWIEARLKWELLGGMYDAGRTDVNDMEACDVALAFGEACCIMMKLPNIEANRQSLLRSVVQNIVFSGFNIPKDIDRTYRDALDMGDRPWTRPPKAEILRVRQRFCL